MEKSKDDILKQIIQKAGPESPSSDFTEFVMHSLQVEFQKEVILNPELKTLLQKNALEKPSADFLMTVMSQVKAPVPQIVATPIISKKVWYMVVAASIVLFTLLGFYYSAVGEVQSNSTRISNLEKIFFFVSTNVTAISSFYSTSLIAISGLLMTDYFLRDKFMKRAF